MPNANTKHAPIATAFSTFLLRKIAFNLSAKPLSVSLSSSSAEFIFNISSFRLLSVLAAV